MSSSAGIPVSVSDLLTRPGRRRQVRLDAEIEGLASSVAEVRGDVPLELDLVLESVSGSIVAAGTVTVHWRGECRRCLKGVDGTLTTRVQEIFERHPVEGETYLLEGDHIDIEPLAREAAMLALPVAAPLCREECAGLCPQCGADRNEVDCECDITVRDPRWAALDDLDLG